MTSIQTLSQEVLWAFFLISILLGVISQRTHFCTLGAVSDIVHLEDWTRARQWVLSVAVAMIGFAYLSDTSLIDPTKALYSSNRFMWLSGVVGGLMFGYGMVNASGCGNKTLVRIGGGNLKSLVVFIVMGISAFATLKGLTAVLRVNSVDRVAIDIPSGSHVGSLLASVLGGDAQHMAILGGYTIGVLLLLFVLARKDFWTIENAIAGAGVGILVVLLWWVSGHLGFVEEHPLTLESVYLATSSGRIESLTFVAPAAYLLDWLIFFSDTSKVLTVGIVSALGVIIGAWMSAMQNRSFRWEGFADVADLARHLIGAVLMGVGGVTAMGCTFGQGVSGLSTLSLMSFVAVLSILLGAVIALKVQADSIEPCTT
ncbi:MAG: YeeE/YedE family protein [Burkholderiales bacterium]|nr:YeeE/YedE family protein [Burkholderiales bacterium]